MGDLGLFSTDAGFAPGFGGILGRWPPSDPDPDWIRGAPGLLSPQPAAGAQAAAWSPSNLSLAGSIPSFSSGGVLGGLDSQTGPGVQAPQGPWAQMLGASNQSPPAQASDPSQMSDADLMAGLGHPASANLRFGPGAPVAGLPITDAQQGYVDKSAPNPQAPKGSLANPLFDYPGSQDLPDKYHVDTNARLHVPAGAAAMDDEQLQAALANSRSGMPWLEDDGRSLITGLEKGIAGLGGIPGDSLKAGARLEARRDSALEKLIGVDVDPRLQSLADGATSAPTGPIPTSDMLNDFTQSVAGPYHTPQSWHGRAMETVGEFAPAAALPGSAALRAARVLAPALGSTAAGELTGQNPYAKFVGALAGGGVLSGAERMGAFPWRFRGAPAADLPPEVVDPVPPPDSEAAQQGDVAGMAPRLTVDTVDPRGAEEPAITGPTEAYDRAMHYGRTPTVADRAAVGAGPGQVADHSPPLVQRYYEGDPATGEKPGWQMTPEERAASASDRTRMSPQPQTDSNSQGGRMSAYSRTMKGKYGL